MVTLIVLAVVIPLARIAGRLGVPGVRDWAGATRVGLAAMFCVTGSAHFNSLRNDLVRMVPPAVPWPEPMVTFTGGCEFAGAVGLLAPLTRRLAAAALIVMLVALLPANIYASNARLTLGGAPVMPLVPRIAMQALFIGLVWWAGIRRARS